MKKFLKNYFELKKETNFKVQVIYWVGLINNHKPTCGNAEHQNKIGNSNRF